MQVNCLARLPGNGRMEKVKGEEITDSFGGGWGWGVRGVQGEGQLDH